MARDNRTQSNHLFDIPDAGRLGSHAPALGLARTFVPHRPRWAVAVSTTSGHQLFEVRRHPVPGPDSTQLTSIVQRVPRAIRERTRLVDICSRTQLLCRVQRSVVLGTATCLACRREGPYSLRTAPSLDPVVYIENDGRCFGSASTTNAAF